MQGSYRFLLIIGFLLQVIPNFLVRRGIELIPGVAPHEIILLGVVIFTLGSVFYARSKGRLWTWGLFGIVLPFFLIVVLIPRKN